LSEEKKKQYYYGGKEKTASEIRKSDQQEIEPYYLQRDFDRLVRHLQRELEDFWNSSTTFGRGLRRYGSAIMPFKSMTMPSVDLEDKGKEFCLTVDMPGFNKEDVNIEVTDDSVTISAQKIQTEDENKKNYVRRERMTQSFYRKIPLPEPINADTAKANLDKGTLEITLPKKEPKETKKLTVT
jgi:HSP20 family protein